VGTYAGQVVMRGFVSFNVPLQLRRAVTMLPALTLLGLGFDPTRALILSQVLLSFGIPLALAPLVLLTRDPRVMGVHVNRPATTVASFAVAGVITALNICLVHQQLWDGGAR
jgi:manganese transport protein